MSWYEDSSLARQFCHSEICCSRCCFTHLEQSALHVTSAPSQKTFQRRGRSRFCTTAASHPKLLFPKTAADLVVGLVAFGLNALFVKVNKPSNTYTGTRTQVATAVASVVSAPTRLLTAESERRRGTACEAPRSPPDTDTTVESRESRHFAVGWTGSPHRWRSRGCTQNCLPTHTANESGGNSLALV